MNLKNELKETFTPTFIGFCIGLVSVILVMCLVVLPYYNMKDNLRADNDLSKIHTCTGIVLFNSHLNSYSMSMDGYTHIQNMMKEKLEMLKCP